MTEMTVIETLLKSAIALLESLVEEVSDLKMVTENLTNHLEGEHPRWRRD
jgi:hypothetical protein